MPLFTTRPSPLEASHSLRSPPQRNPMEQKYPTVCAPPIENASTTELRKRRVSIRHSLASTFSFASLSTLRRRPSLASTKASAVSPPLITTRSPSKPKSQVTRLPNLTPGINGALPVIVVDSLPPVQMEGAPGYDEERSRSGGGWKRHEGRTTVNDPHFLALLTMDISHPILLGSSYAGEVRDLPGRSERGNESKPTDMGSCGYISVKEVVELLERVSLDCPLRRKNKRTY
jgi:hypothetical protein